MRGWVGWYVFSHEKAGCAGGGAPSHLMVARSSLLLALPPVQVGLIVPAGVRAMCLSLAISGRQISRPAMLDIPLIIQALLPTLAQ